MDGEIRELRMNAPQETLDLLAEALSVDGEYDREPDLLAYALLLGFHLETLERSRDKLRERGEDPQAIYQTMYEELARAQAHYARDHFSFAESARDDLTGKMVDTALRREVAATKKHLIPRLKRQRDQLLQRRTALLRTLGDDR